jgi:hypothetical protein
MNISRRGLAVITGFAIAASVPAYVMAFGFDADMQCTNSQLDYSCQKGTRCPSKKQGGKGTDCVDTSSNTPGKCTAYRVCTDMNSGHRQTSRQELQDASPWGDTPLGNNPGEAWNLPGPEMTGATDLSSYFGSDAWGGAADSGDTGSISDAGSGPAPESGGPSGDASAAGNDNVPFTQEHGVAAPQGAFPQDIPQAVMRSFPSDVTAPPNIPDTAAGNTGGPLQDRAELKPEQSGGAGGSEQQSGSGQQGAGGMPSLPGGGGGSGSGSGSSKPQQPATGFASQQSPQQATPQNTGLLSGVTSQLSRLWGWLTGQGTTGGSAGSSAPVSIPL